ncbi:MAG: hypothetical protein O7D91_06225 [Planctomycetota bacterium]|nr:hypothetical protein [Planctomycetota bacterium]
MLALVITGASYIAIPVIWLGSLAMQRSLFEPLQNARFGQDQLSALGPMLAGIVVQEHTVPAILATYLFLPGFVAAVCALPAALIWRRPQRYLVLRRFDDRAASRTLNRALNRHLAPAGHVYTLADQDIHVPWYIRFPLVFTQLIFLHFRQRRIRSRAGIDRLVAAMGVRWARNVNWVVARSKTFAIGCTDEHWQDLVTRLTGEVDAVLVDVSTRSASIEWEIERLIAGGQLGRTVFLAREAQRTEAREFLRSLGIDAGDDTVLLYDTEQIDRLKDRLPRASGARSTAPLAGHLVASLLMVGPLAWGALAIGSLVWLSSETGPSAESRFAGLVEQVRLAPGDEAALYALLDEVAAGPPARAAESTTPLDAHLDELGPLSWQADFTDAVIPLLLDLWDRAPEDRGAMLASVRDIGTPSLAPLWRKAIADLANDARALEPALEGVARARSRANVPDVLAALRSVPPAGAEEAMLRTLGDLADPRAVTLLLENYVLQLNGARPDALRAVADGALQNILLRPVLPHGPPIVGDGTRPALTIALMATDRRTLEGAFEAIAQDAQAAGTLESVGVALGGVPMPPPVDGMRLPLTQLVVNAARHRLSLIVSHSFERLAAAIVAGLPIPDAALIVVDPSSDWEGTLAQQVSLARHTQIPHLLVVRPFARDLALDQAFDARADALGLVPASIVKLPGTLAEALPRLVREIDRELDPVERAPVFPIVAVADVRDRGTLAIGYFESDRFAQGQTLDVVGFGAAGRVTLRDTEEMIGGRRVGLWLAGAEDLELQPGHALTTGGVTEQRELEAWVYFLRPHEGGRRAPVLPGQSLTLQMRGVEIGVGLELPPLGWALTGGDHARLILRPTQALYAPLGSRFSLWSRNAVIGVGVVSGETGHPVSEISFDAPAPTDSMQTHLERAKQALETRSLEVAKQNAEHALSLARKVADASGQFGALVLAGNAAQLQAQEERRPYRLVLKFVEAAARYAEALRLLEWGDRTYAKPASIELRKRLLSELVSIARSTGQAEAAQGYQEALRALNEK